MLHAGLLSSFFCKVSSISLFTCRCNDAEKTLYETQASRCSDFASQPVVIPRINISLHYGNAGHMEAKLPPNYNSCPVRTYFDRRNKMREACGKSLEVTGCVAKASDKGNRPNGFILGGAKPTAKGYHVGSHKELHFFPDSKGYRSSYKRLNPCPYRDGHPSNGSHRLFSLKCRREKTLANLSMRHHPHNHQHRISDELTCKEPAHHRNLGKEGSQEPLVATEKSDVGDGRGVQGGVSFSDQEPEAAAAAAGSSAALASRLNRHNRTFSVAIVAVGTAPRNDLMADGSV